MPQNTLQSVLAEVGLAIAPLRTINTPARGVEFFRKLGFEIPTAAFGGALPALATAAGDLIAAVRQLTQATGDAGIAAALANMIGKLGAAVDAIGQLHTQVRAGAGSISGIDDLPRRLTDFLVLDYFDVQRPQIHAALHLVGLIEHEPAPAPGQSTRLINWNRFGQFLSEPGRIANDVYGWGADFDTGKLLGRLEGLMRAASLPGGLYPQSDTTLAALGNSSGSQQELRMPIFKRGLTADTYSQFGVTFSPVDAQGGKKKGVALLPFIMGAAKFDFDVCDRGELVFLSTADLKGIGIVLRPPFDAEGILGLTGAFRAVMQIREKPERAVETILLGSPGGSRLAVQGLGVNWLAQTSQGKIDLGVEAEIQALRLVIGGGEGDGFLQKLLSGLHVQAETNLAFGMSLLSGFTFRGGAKLAVDVAVHLDLGPLSIQGLRVALAPSGDRIGLDVGAMLKCDFGPFKAVVENIGLTAALRFQQGNLGPADLAVSFKPPTGVGLSLDAGVIKGGGYLALDFEKGEYAGALELTFSGFIALKAIGIINTKMADGSKGFALLILITAEFPPLQLGFGFTLIGVGGLLALNRRLDTEALRIGVRTGAVNSILFPQDIVANITRIISDIKLIFPLAADHFIIGPMGKIGWGTPTLISLELGVILDLPTPAITILGVLRCILPDEEVAILKLQVNFAGGIDFDRGLIWFDASLFDSRLLIYTLTGDMALRIGWGDQAIFILTVGGFHPAFKEIPPDLRGMRRMGISLLSGDNPRLSSETYFAVTSNTVQSGARVELYAEACGFNIYGFLGYDLLVQFNPFHFIADLYAGLALREGTDVLMGISVHAELSGPNPFRARGEASFEVLCFEISIDFDVSWGDDAPGQIEDEVDVFPLVKAALEDDRNWLATLPPNTHQNVTFKKIELPPERIVLNPFAVLSVSQKVVPLGLEINKFGNQRPKGVTRFELTFAGGGTEEVREEFAMANFQRLSDDERIALKCFDKLRSGLRFSTGNSPETGANTEKEVTYELSYVHRKRGLTIRAGLMKMLGSAFSMLAAGGAIAKSKQAVSQRTGNTPPARIELKEPEYSVVNLSDLEPHAPGLVAKTETEARQLYRELIATNPGLRGQIQVMSSHELN
jgi:hypothetical protein